MVAALIEVDHLLAHEPEPSVDDWGSMGSAMGKIACGLLVHDILPRVFHHALPSWSSMGPAENDHAADNVQAYRIRIQKKLWRASKILSEPHRRKKMLLLCWVAWPVERLQSELEWLHNHGKGLVEVAFDDFCNPFFKARVDLSQLVHDAQRGR